MNYIFQTILFILGLIGLDAFLIWALYSIIMLVVTGASTMALGTLVLGGILLWLFGGLVMIGALFTTVALLALLWSMINR